MQIFSQKDFARLEEAEGCPSVNHQSGPRMPSQPSGAEQASRQAGAAGARYESGQNEGDRCVASSVTGRDSRATRLRCVHY